MKHLYVFYLFAAFSLGFISLGIVGFLYVRTRETLLAYYLLFFSSFSLLAGSSVGLSYVFTNISEIQGERLEMYGDVFGILVMLTTPLFMHFLLSTPHAKLKNSIISGLAVLMSLLHPLIKYVFNNRHTLVQLIKHGGHVILLVVLAYTIYIGWRGSGKVENADKKSLARLFSLLLTIFLPGLALDFVIDDVYGYFGPVFFPMLYIITGGVFSYQCIKLYGHHQQPLASAQSGAASEALPVEDLFEQHAISPREQEVIHLILQGCSNQKIGDTLSISLSTVKKHITSIYQKCDVKSRYELIALFTHITLPSSPDSQ
jgi:DNA-binding CsgD family transcriptional regulator